MTYARGTRAACLTSGIGLLALLATGCGSESTFRPQPKPPPWEWTNDSPQALMLRFDRTYEFQDLPNYERLFTSDFRYTFSQASDPTLVATYGNAWGKEDETESSRHLFEGYTNTGAELIPAASRIEVEFMGVQYQPDYMHADSTDHYMKVIVGTVNLQIEVPTTPDSTVYQISARHEFFVVRGDAAVLDEGQEARSDRWYVRRWDDLSTSLSGAPASSDGPTPARTTTWGSLKAQYR